MRRRQPLRRNDGVNQQLFEGEIAPENQDEEEEELPIQGEGHNNQDDNEEALEVALQNIANANVDNDLVEIRPTREQLIAAAAASHKKNLTESKYSEALILLHAQNGNINIEIDVAGGLINYLRQGL
jgi:hypothetical protein